MTFRVRFALLTSVCQFFPAPAGHRLGDTPLSCFRACTIPREAPRILPPKTSWEVSPHFFSGLPQESREEFSDTQVMSGHLCSRPLPYIPLFCKVASYSQDGPSWPGAQHCLFVLQLSPVCSLYSSYADYFIFWSKCIYSLHSGNLRTVTQGIISVISMGGGVSVTLWNDIFLQIKAELWYQENVTTGPERARAQPVEFQHLLANDEGPASGKSIRTAAWWQCQIAFS